MADPDDDDDDNEELDESVFLSILALYLLTG